MTTKVKVKCISKKESKHYSGEKDAPKITTAIELQVPYDTKSIYYQLSGGTSFLLNTINKEAADMFVIDQEYDVFISPATPE